MVDVSRHDGSVTQAVNKQAANPAACLDDDLVPAEVTK
jgi:hypothetical protein